MKEAVMTFIEILSELQWLSEQWARVKHNWMWHNINPGVQLSPLKTSSENSINEQKGFHDI